MNNTQQEILRIADGLIRNYGFNSFSYSDISTKLNIKNAAIHYYFPSKAELGVAVIRAAKNLFESNTKEWGKLDKRGQYVAFITSYNKSNFTSSLSLVSALSVSYELLTDDMKNELKLFIETKHNWLSDLLEAGKTDGTFTFAATSDMMAYMVHSHIFSSLALGRIMQDDIYLNMQKEIMNLV